MFSLEYLLLTVGVTVAYPNGAPAQSCGTVEPSHRVTAQSVPSPFNVTISKTSEQNFVVSITTLDGKDSSFKGFLAVAMNSTGALPTGVFFNPSTGVQTGPCASGSGKAASITHSSSETKSFIHAEWSPEPGSSGQVCFRVAVVLEYSKWWSLDNPAYCVKVEDTVNADILPEMRGHNDSIATIGNVNNGNESFENQTFSAPDVTDQISTTMEAEILQTNGSMATEPPSSDTPTVTSEQTVTTQTYAATDGSQLYDNSTTVQAADTTSGPKQGPNPRIGASSRAGSELPLPSCLIVLISLIVSAFST